MQAVKSAIAETCLRWMEMVKIKKEGNRERREKVSDVCRHESEICYQRRASLEIAPPVPRARSALAEFPTALLQTHASQHSPEGRRDGGYMHIYIYIWMGMYAPTKPCPTSTYHVRPQSRQLLLQALDCATLQAGKVQAHPRPCEDPKEGEMEAEPPTCGRRGEVEWNGRGGGGGRGKRRW